MAFVSIAIVIRRNDGTVASINGRRGTRWFLGNAVWRNCIRFSICIDRVAFSAEHFFIFWAELKFITFYSLNIQKQSVHSMKAHL